MSLSTSAEVHPDVDEQLDRLDGDLGLLPSAADVLGYTQAVGLLTVTFESLFDGPNVASPPYVGATNALSAPPLVEHRWSGPHRIFHSTFWSSSGSEGIVAAFCEVGYAVPPGRPVLMAFSAFPLWTPDESQAIGFATDRAERLSQDL